MDKKEVTFVRCLKCQKILQCSRYDTSTLLQHIRTDHPEVEILNRDSKDVKSNKLKDNKSQNGNQDQPKINNVKENGISNGKDNKREKGSQKTENQGERTARTCECADDQEIHEMGVNNDKYHKSGKDKSQSQQEEVYRGYKIDTAQIPESDRTNYTIRSELMEKYPEIKDIEFCPRNPNANVIYTKRYKLKTPSTVSAITSPESPQNSNMYRTTIEKWRPASGTIYCPQCGCNKRPLIKSRTEQLTQNQCFACCLFSCWPFCFLPCLIPEHEVEYLHCSNCKTFLGLYNRSLNCIKPNREYVTCDNGKVDNRNVKINTADFVYTDNSSAVDSQKSNKKHLPSIVIDGKELHPDMVARLQSFRKYGHLAGIDLDAVTEDNNSEYSPLCADSFRAEAPCQKKATSGRSIQSKGFSGR